MELHVEENEMQFCVATHDGHFVIDLQCHKMSKDGDGILKDCTIECGEDSLCRVLSVMNNAFEEHSQKEGKFSHLEQILAEWLKKYSYENRFKIIALGITVYNQADFVQK